MSRKKSPYFDGFIEMVGYSCRAAEHLQLVLGDFNYADLQEHRETMHELEHGEDGIKHVMLQRLAKEFVSPIDREDIIQLANELDNVTDIIEDILIRMYVYNVRQIRPAAIAFTDVIVRSCHALQAAVKEFPNFQKSTELMKSIIAVNTLEEEGDALYISAMRELYETCDNAVEIVVWSELFDRFEECCDACEHVADAMEIVAMKNS